MTRTQIRADALARERRRLHMAELWERGVRHSDPEYGSLVATFHEASACFDTLWDFDPEAKESEPYLNDVLTYLEEDPHCFRSGYLTARLLRRLKRCRLDAQAAERFKVICVEACRSRDRREFREFCRAARMINPPALRESLVELTGAWQNAGVNRRASWMLGYLDL